MVLLYNFLRFGSVTHRLLRLRCDGGERLVSAWGFLFTAEIFLYSHPAPRCAACRFLAQPIRDACWPCWPLSCRCCCLLSFASGGRLRLGSALRGLRVPVSCFRPSLFSLARADRALAGGRRCWWSAFAYNFWAMPSTGTISFASGLDVRSRVARVSQSQRLLTADKGGFCEGCSRQYPTVVLGPFQPILVISGSSGMPWARLERASQDAPWRVTARLTSTPRKPTNGSRRPLALRNRQIPDRGMDRASASPGRGRRRRRSLRSTHGEKLIRPSSR